MARLSPPARLPCQRHHLGTNRFWSLRPRGTSAKNWNSNCLGEHRAAVLAFEWIAQGFTEESFWTAPWRLITGLEDRLRCQVRGHNTLACPSSPNRCLAGGPAVANTLARQASLRAAKRNQVGIPVLRTRKRKKETFRQGCFFSVDPPGLIGVGSTIINLTLAKTLGSHLSANTP